MSKFARLIHSVKGEEEGPKARGKSRREDYTALKVYVPKDLHRALKLKAVEEGKEISEMVEEALRTFLGKAR
ncbi:MAG: ribbon-helix-helix protein, CopG family [Thermus sp.]|uniref:ribbon-helix-helix protein, CopG family n=1 Tax=Thermus TaxID=270 RepID=UPI001FA9EDCE|nr:ribbon-helix-helix protein, CopG family [Thermus neutrinimicus]